MEALLRIDPSLHFEIFCQTPPWFFDSLPVAAYTLNPTVTDIGMIQVTPMEEDIPGTLQALAGFVSGFDRMASSLGKDLRVKGCRLALCDISPLGITAAHYAEIPSILVENFTWDWIYSAYLPQESQFEAYIRFFRDWFARADHHLQTEPLCQRIPGLPLFPPASRNPHLAPDLVKERLKIPADGKTALVSLGGLLKEYPVIAAARTYPDWTFLVPDASPKIEHRDNLVLLPQHFEIGHPDLVQASDVLVAKSGYSTIAEAYASGTAYGYLNRPSFPESPGLENFLLREMRSAEIPLEEMVNGSWVNRLDGLAALPHCAQTQENGADLIANYIYTQFD
jgi:hypothetical protein